MKPDISKPRCGVYNLRTEEKDGSEGWLPIPWTWIHFRPQAGENRPFVLRMPDGVFLDAPKEDMKLGLCLN